MKIIKNNKVFQPITLVIENESELRVLLSALNVNNKYLKDSALTMSFELTEEDLSIADTMFYDLDKFVSLE